MALWRIRATVDDRPGYLSVLTASLALRSVNILAVQVHTTEAGAVDDFLIDAPDTLTEVELLSAIARGRGRDAFVARADAQGLADQPTWALTLAGRLVHEPDALGETLIALLNATEARWRPDPLPDRPAHDGGRMTLAGPSGGSYEVLRDQPGFTPAEFARAQALVEFCGTIVRREQEQTTLLLPDGVEVVVRAAAPNDLQAVHGLHERASAAALQHRYLAAGTPRGARLHRLLQRAGGRTLLAVAADGQVTAMANLLTEGDLGQIAVMVEDGWQRRGIGTALLRRLLAHAQRGGLAALVAHTTADDMAMLRTLRRLGEVTTERDGALVSVTLPVPDHRPVVSDAARSRRDR